MPTEHKDPAVDCLEWSEGHTGHRFLQVSIFPAIVLFMKVRRLPEGGGEPAGKQLARQDGEACPAPAASLTSVKASVARSRRDSSDISF